MLSIYILLFNIYLQSGLVIVTINYVHMQMVLGEYCIEREIIRVSVNRK
jgi:hypothetical protein